MPGPEDEGLSLSSMLLMWTLQRLRKGADFEVLEAYLHRILEVYADVIMASVELLPIARRVGEVHLPAPPSCVI